LVPAQSTEQGGTPYSDTGTFWQRGTFIIQKLLKKIDMSDDKKHPKNEDKKKHRLEKEDKLHRPEATIGEAPSGGPNATERSRISD
tara:strand:- start:431 stop:688 length:258 start_codon:yes stop_codon:yes gene_type:complete